MTEQAIERRTMPDVVLGGGDMAELVEQTRRNVEAAIQFARERKQVTDFPIIEDGKKVGTRLWFHHPTWQLLGQSFGLTAYTEGEPIEVKPGNWRAAAVAARVDTGIVVGRAVALCARSEYGMQKKVDHDIQAKAQTRAQRNALRSALGAIMVAAGFEIADPEAPATTEQVGLLHKLARDVYGSEAEAKAVLEVQHFRDLTREQAADLIETLDQRLSEAHNPHSTPAEASELSGASVSVSELKGPAPDGEAGEERPDKRTGEDTAAAAPSSPAGRKESAVPKASSSPPGAAEGPAAGSGRPAAGPPSQDHVHDWQPAPRASMAAKGWRICSTEGCGKVIGPGEAG
jgi:hypothetical protein